MPSTLLRLSPIVTLAPRTHRRVLHPRLPFKPALVTVCHVLFIIRIIIIVKPYRLFRRPGYARDDLHWAAPVAGNRRFFAVYLRVELPYHLR